MASIYTQESNNIWKSYILMTVFFAVVGGLGYILSLNYNSPGIFYFALAVSFVMNAFSFWFSDSIALSISKARPVTKGDYPDYWNIVENLSISSGLSMPRVYVIDDPAPNAFATGRDKEHSSVAITTGLLDIMDKVELEGVIAHELSHIGNRDILLMGVVVVLVGAVSVLSNIFINGNIFRGRDNNEKSGSGLVAVIAIISIIIAPIVAILLKLAVSRRRELLADTSGVLLTRYPEGLARALEKIGKYEKPMHSASTATAHLFISSPFGGKSASGMIAGLFNTHPPIEERIKILRSMNL